MFPASMRMVWVAGSLQRFNAFLGQLAANAHRQKPLLKSARFVESMLVTNQQGKGDRFCL